MQTLSAIRRDGFLGAVLTTGILGCFATYAQQVATTSARSDSRPLRLAVNEVVVTFNATDANGSAITDLKAEEFLIRDNRVAPRRIVSFEPLTNRPIRVGILLDTSESMRDSLALNRAIAQRFVEKRFRQKTDAGFVASFEFGSAILKSWSHDREQIIDGIQIAGGKQNGRAGTALFNAVFQACSSSFANVDPTRTGNIILLFSDGEDNAGLTSLNEASRACQSSNTEVFAFLSGNSSSGDSTGPRALRELAAKTGGRVFRADDRTAQVCIDLSEIESEMRNQYRLVYAPADLKRDGAFHEVELQPPDRVSRIFVRSGYFAPRQ